MWSDPIELAAIKGENRREADKRGITLDELLQEQKAKVDYETNKKNPPEPPKTRYIDSWTGEVFYEPYPKREKSSWTKFWYWFFRMD